MLKKKWCILQLPDEQILCVISVKGWDDFANLIVIRRFFFFFFFFFILEVKKRPKGNLLVIHDNESE